MSLSGLSGLSGLGGIVNAGGGGDVVAPTLSSATIDATGLVLTLVFSEAVTGSSGFTLDASGGAVTATYDSGDGTDTLVFDLSDPIAAGETLTLDYTAGDVEDLAGNALAGFTGTAVTNNSTANFAGISVAPTWGIHAADAGVADGAEVSSHPARYGSIAATAAAGQRPLYRADAGDGLPALEYDGTDDFSTVTGVLTGTSYQDAYAVFIGAKCTRGTDSGGIGSPATQMLYGNWTNNYFGMSGTGRNYQMVMSGITLGTSINNNTPASTGSGVPSGSPASINKTSPYGSQPQWGAQVMWQAWNGTELLAGVNQHSATVATTGDITLNTNNFLLGKYGGGVHFKGYLRMAVAYLGNALSSSDAAAVARAVDRACGAFRRRPEIYYFTDSIGEDGTSWVLPESALGSIKGGWRRNLGVGGAAAISTRTYDLTWQVDQAIALFSDDRLSRIGVFSIGTNDIRQAASTTAHVACYAAVKAQAQRFLDAGGTHVVGVTMLPAATASSHASFETDNRPGFNAAMIADSAFWDAVADPGGDVRLADGNDTTLYHDGVHLTRTARSYVAEDVNLVLDPVVIAAYDA